MGGRNIVRAFLRRETSRLRSNSVCKQLAECLASAPEVWRAFDGIKLIRHLCNLNLHSGTLAMVLICEHKLAQTTRLARGVGSGNFTVNRQRDLHERDLIRDL